MNTSCIKTIKTTYSAYRGSKTIRKKGMNEYLEVEKEAGAYEAAGRIVEERFVRESRQAVAKYAHHPPLQVVRVRRRHEESLELKFHRKKLLGQSWALQSLRKRRRWLLRSFRVSVVEALPLQKEQRLQRGLSQRFR